MAQTTDIILNGAGYMIEPGTHQSPGYRRTQDGMAEGLTQRTSITDFFGGGNRVLQLERDTFGKSLNVGPALGGQGVAPWALKASSTPDIPIPVGDDVPVGGIQVPYQVVEPLTRIFFAIGKTLYFRVYGAAGTGTVVVKSYPDVITDLSVINGTTLLIAFGGAADILMRTSAGVENPYLTGEKAFKIQIYNGFPIWSDARSASFPGVLRMGTPGGVNYRIIDYDVLDLITVDGDLLVVTKQALYKFSGRVREVLVPNPAHPTDPDPQIPGWEWSGDFVPFFQQGIHTERDDFRFVLGFGGRTIAWIAGGVHEFTPTGDRAGWKSLGLNGLLCYGACVAAGYLIVSILSEAYFMELWAWDGNGWWRFGSQVYAPTGNWCWPIPLGGSVDYDIFVFQHGLASCSRYRLAHRPSGITAFAADAEWRSPLIDAGERDKRKAWRKIGVTFVAPERFGPSSSDTVTTYLDYSLNSGQTWVNAASYTSTGNLIPQINFDLEAALSGVVSRFLVLRVRWESVSDYAPILVGAWAEHEALDNPARRRKWNLKIHARDQEIDRDGVTLTRTGRQLIAELWSAWATDTTLTFRDIDYDDAPVQRSVRIVGISESVAQPADSNEWGDSLIILQLVEV